MPENGEVLTPKIIEIVGSSTAITGSGFGLSTERDRFADLDVVKPGKRDDLADAGRNRPLSVRGLQKRTAL